MPKVQHLAVIETSPDLTEQVYERLLNAICDGELPPGSRITQEECAASFNVSRQPVLQALRSLKKDGLVVDAGRRGVMVTPLEANVVAQIYEVRTALDALAARLAAQRGAKLDPALISRGREAARGKRTAPMIEADEAFHRAIYEASGNPFILQSAARHWPHIRRVMGLAVGEPDNRDPVWDEHESILRAINAGNAAEAERLSLKHGEFGGKAVSARLAHLPRAASSPT
jgi:DNA-binding GntR family transcriptional regulator